MRSGKSADALMFATANPFGPDLMSDVSAYAPATARQVMFDVKAIRLVSRQPPAAVERYLVTVRPMQSTRRRLRHAVLPFTAGKLNVECSR